MPKHHAALPPLRSAATQPLLDSRLMLPTFGARLPPIAFQSGSRGDTPSHSPTPPKSPRSPRALSRASPRPGVSLVPAIPPLLARFQHKLTSSELAEARSLGELYFFDPYAGRVVPDPAKPNDGYDTADGFYVCFMHDHLSFRFELLRNLGGGSFSDVMAAYDHKLGRDVAVKIIANNKHANETARHEISILAHLAAQGPVAHTIRMHEHFVFRQHTCMVLERLDGGDLFDLIRQCRRSDTTLSAARVRQLATALLRCVDEVHSRGVIHCDIKPENVMVGADGAQLTMIDFGLSCLQSETSNSHSFGSMAYSAPEVVLGGWHDTALDMWSVGCTLAELVLGRPLFACGSQAELLGKHVAALGMPPQSLLLRCKRSALFFTRSGADGEFVVPTRAEAGSRSVESELAGKTDSEVVEVVARCLRWEPRERISAAEALRLLAGPVHESELRICALGSSIDSVDIHFQKSGCPTINKSERQAAGQVCAVPREAQVFVRWTEV